MSATQLLQIPEVRERLSPVSVEEYHQFPERNHRGRRTELVRGIVIEKMSKSPLHSWISTFLHTLILRSIPLEGFSVWKDEPLTFIDSEPEPDIAVVGANEIEFRQQHPTTALLVIEVAVTSLALDRAKAEIYAEAGVLEYWIVDTATKHVEVYRLPADGRYTAQKNFGLMETIKCQSIPSIQVAVRSLFP
jgi:Uma2 family endonuclease